MSYFQIHWQSLSTFFRSFHQDVLQAPQYHGGDVRRIGASEFGRIAEDAWGLCNWQWDESLGTYIFEIRSEERLDQIGLLNRGKLVSNRYGEFGDD